MWQCLIEFNNIHSVAWQVLPFPGRGGIYHRETLTVTHNGDIYEDVRGFPSGSGVKNIPVKQDIQVSIPGLGRFPWRRAWQPSPVSLPGKSQGQRSLAVYGPWGHKESDMTSTHTSVQFSHSVVSDSLHLYGLQHASSPCPSPIPRVIQTHVHWVGDDAIQPSHPLSSPSPLAFNLCQHQGLFKWVSSSHQVAKVWEFQLQHQYLQWIFRSDFL